MYKQIDYMECEDCTKSERGRYESRVLFTSLKNDTDKSKQYFFSMSTYYSLVELFDIENFTYYAWDTLKFFNLARPIFSYEYSLFEIEGTNSYIAAFIESAGFAWTKVSTNPDKWEEKEFSNTTTIRKFKLDNFASSGHRTIENYAILNNTYNGRVASAFRLEDSDLNALIFVKSTGEKTGSYVIYFYDDNLVKKNEVSIYNDVKNLWVGFGIFIKGINVKGDYAAFAFFHDGDSGVKDLNFRFVKYKSDDASKFNYLYELTIDDYFRKDIASNGLYKLDDNRVVLFTTKNHKIDEQNTVDYGSLYMYLFDFYNGYEGCRVRQYHFEYPDRRFCKEMAAYDYNGYVLLTATLGDSNQENIFAIMMIFGFGNGTDFETDISPFLMDTDYYIESDNLYTFLINKMTIDNNIFGYEKVEKIRLVKICDELLLYRGKLNIDKEENTLPLNELFNENHTLLQNKNIKKQENKIYTL